MSVAPALEASPRRQLVKRGATGERITMTNNVVSSSTKRFARSIASRNRGLVMPWSCQKLGGDNSPFASAGRSEIVFWLSHQSAHHDGGHQGGIWATECAID